MEDAPLLKANGALVFASAEAFAKHYEQYLAKGGALVRSEAALKPLQTLEVRIALPSSGEVQLKAQVTSLHGPLCLLHFIHVPDEVAQKLRAALTAPPPSDEVMLLLGTEEEDPSSAPTPVPVLAPEPVTSPEQMLRQVAAMVAQVPPEGEVPERPPPPPPTPAASKPAASVPAPPTAAAAPGLAPTPVPAASPLPSAAPAGPGAFRLVEPQPKSPSPTPAAKGPSPGPASPPMSFQLVDPAMRPTPVPGASPSPSPVSPGGFRLVEPLVPAPTPVPRGTPVPGQGATPVPGGMAEATMRELAAAVGPSAAAATTASANLLKGERAFKNPTTPTEFLALPLVRPPSGEQVSEPSLPQVLQWLGVLKAQSVCLKLKVPKVRDIAFYVLWGQDIRTSTPIETLVRALAEPAGALDVTPGEEPPKLPFAASLVSVRFAVLRELLKHYSEPDLTAAMSARHGMAPKLNAHGLGLLRVLGLSDSQLRMGQRLLGGQHALDLVLHNGIGVRSTWQVIYLQQLLAGLTWVDPPHRESAAVEEMRALAERVRADHFSALGLHITSAPRAVDKAYERMKREYGPSSPAATQSPKLAEDILKHVEAAYQVLKTAAGRRQYRKEKFATVRLDYQAQIVKAQAQLAEMRGELDVAIDLMETAVELDPSAADHHDHLRRIQGKKSGR